MPLPLPAVFAAWVLLSGAFAQQPTATTPPLAPIDFGKLDRTPPKLPPEVSKDAIFGIYLFGLDGSTRVWALLDRSRSDGPYDVLWFDGDADGEWTAAERHTGKVKDPKNVAFALGDYRPPGGDATHKDFRITWTEKLGVRFRLRWRGEKDSFGGYGPSNDSYAGFAAKAAEAPVFVPGWDRPFGFERWIAEPLRRGEDVDFKVFVGNRGDRTGTFSTVDDEFLPAGDHAIATLHYIDGKGEPATARFELKQRC